MRINPMKPDFKDSSGALKLACFAHKIVYLDANLAKDGLTWQNG